jgi:hypothetical protein
MGLKYVHKCRVISFDPGETTGFAIAEITTGVVSSTTEVVAIGQFKESSFVNEAIDSDCDQRIVTCESFFNAGPEMNLAPVRVTGAIQFKCAGGGVPVKMQAPSVPKFITKRYLMDYKLPKSLKSVQHGLDAFCHLLYFTRDYFSLSDEIVNQMIVRASELPSERIMKLQEGDKWTSI